MMTRRCRNLDVLMRLALPLVWLLAAWRDPHSVLQVTEGLAGATRLSITPRAVRIWNWRQSLSPRLAPVGRRAVCRNECRGFGDAGGCVFRTRRLFRLRPTSGEPAPRQGRPPSAMHSVQYAEQVFRHHGSRGR